MPIFLLANWRWLIPSALAAVLAIWLGLVKIELADLQLSVEKQKTEAAQKLAAITSDVADKDRKADEISRNYEERHAQDVAKADADRGDFDRRLADGVRDARRRARSDCPVSSPAAGSGQPSIDSGGSDGGHSIIDTEAVHRVRDVALKLQADVKECVGFLNSIGR